jgi:cyclase
MNRRDFLVRSSLFATAGLLARAKLAAQTPVPSTGSGQAVPAARPATAPAPVTPEFKPLRRDVGFFTARGGTIGWLSNKDALVAIDTQFPDTAAMFLSGLPGRGGRKLDLLINTHHHGDHTGGNGVFKPETKKIVAHANVPALQRAAAERSKTLAAQVYADTTFPETWRTELGGETISARYHGPAHTSGDIITVFEKANVIHLGDLVFNRMYPVIDRPAGASVRGWIRVLEAAAKTYPADAIYIFGHGNPKFGVSGQRGDLLVLRDYWSAVLAHVEKEIAAGKKKEQVVGMENLAGFPDFHSPLPNRLGGNLGVAYDELTEKKS